MVSAGVLSPERAWCGAGVVGEVLVEVGRFSETQSAANRCDRLVGVGQESFRLQDGPVVDDVLGCVRSPFGRICWWSWPS
jgi:hypothetical protein